MENYLRLQVVGKGGREKGTVIDEVITFTELDAALDVELIVMDKINTMREHLKKHESDYSPELKKELGI